MFPNDRIIGFTLNLPNFDIAPEHMTAIHDIPVEFMLMCLMHGAWVIEADWKLYARYAIANRINNRHQLIFTDEFESIKDDFRDFQLHGGGFSLQKKLKVAASKAIINPVSTIQDKTCARLILSTMDDIEVNTVIQPFHWIRACLAATESNPMFAGSLVNSEMRRQKVTLNKMLRSSS